MIYGDINIICIQGFLGRNTSTLFQLLISPQDRIRREFIHNLIILGTNILKNFHPPRNRPENHAQKKGSNLRPLSQRAGSPPFRVMLVLKKLVFRPV